ncbi:MAG: 3-oxoacyl-[acyl-carrier-protein] reductase [Candidatus Aureabacteria bacterium]|nr:3-oxoacyl-[acyl-carrier-protein] reductase [Candidatus Auribacterota bacterium]
MMDFSGRIALITGASQGIGKEIALKFAEKGADVALCDVQEEKVKETADLCREKGVTSSYYICDVSSEESVRETVNKVLDNFSKIDILVNNAGVTRDGLLMKMSEQDWDLVLKVNLKGTFNFTKTLSRIMMKQRKGCIVNIASIIGIIGNVGQANYSASKAGVIGLTKSSAKELAKRNIRVNAVAPGFIKTAMTEKIPEDIASRMKEQIPLGYFGEPGCVADAVLFLCSEYSSYITGQVLVVDGGMVM